MEKEVKLIFNLDGEVVGVEESRIMTPDQTYIWLKNNGYEREAKKFKENYL
jgi:hypothetical protein